ncbi:MAG: hypothetical protein HY721_24990 [Planctomycetes bacterium]|nr:hypothetical protein [Planctomycetota bacterium]
MRKTKLLSTAGAVLWLATSCIVSDELTTLTIHQDGSADWVRFRSNIRSTEKGEKGAEELKAHVEELDAGRDPECVRLRECGGEVLEARWVRRQEPCASVVAGRLPGPRALESFCTFKDDKGEPMVQARFVQEVHRRRLTLALRVPKDNPLVANPKPTETERRQEQANGLSETRIAVSGGRIVASRGFTVAEDKRSALLDVGAVQDLLRAGAGQVEISLEWELSGS